MSQTVALPALEALSVETFAATIRHHLRHDLALDEATAKPDDWRLALSLALRALVVDPWLESERQVRESGAKRVHYLSMEFLMGRLVEDVAMNLRVDGIAKDAMASLGQDYQKIVAMEPDAALGNGGLGRLAACFLDSLSALSLPAYGYGIRYEHGLFMQSFENGVQREAAETWLSHRHVWEFKRPHLRHAVGFGGTVKKGVWEPAETLMAQAYDTPVIGWKAGFANTLRLWAAEAPTPFDLTAFNGGDYRGAAAAEMDARTISRVLYPDDTTPEGEELRLKQEYFFTAASITDLLTRLVNEGRDLTQLADFAAVQLNDTHPAVAGPELVRQLVDIYGMEMARALTVARHTLAYTNHTLLPEALERWSGALFARLLPRHMEIIRIIEKDHAKTGSPVRILEDGQVKMGELAFIMAHKVNGVSALHSELVKETVFADLHGTYPDRIINQTNGITPRRWLYNCNAPLRGLLDETIGRDWQDDLTALQALEPHANDAGFRDAFAAQRMANKQRLAHWLKKRDGVVVNTDAMFDVQIKRLHEYKRQLMNLLETVAYWNDLKDGKATSPAPRVKIFGGKAAPGYVVAKQIIHLINDVTAVVNEDAATRDMLQVVYPANYNVSMAEMLIPATDLSEQISTAGKEASGTGNMKFALNGALTIGTLDGANVEIREHVGADNFYLFGLTAAEVVARREEKNFALNAIKASPRLARVLEQIEGGVFSPGDKKRHASLVQRLKEDDYFLVTCDFDDYYRVQREVDAGFADQADWWRKSVLNTARMGWFSSDRTISGYAKDIWNVHPIS
ncbi:MAG: glycogen/starch/alpha-glucan phosphorylase [Pseudomonadota bacterium]